MLSCKASAYRASDFQPNNVLMGIQDNSVLDEFAKMANENPAQRKELSNRIIYVSQPMPLTKGLPSLSDFSEARFGTFTQSGLIMPNVYRAPEVILDMEWSYPVDIWSFAMTVSASSRKSYIGAVIRSFVTQQLIP